MLLHSTASVEIFSAIKCKESVKFHLAHLQYLAISWLRDVMSGIDCFLQIVSAPRSRTSSMSILKLFKVTQEVLDKY